MIRGFLKESSLTFALRVLSAGLGLLLSIILARWLGPAGFGVFSYALAWLGLSVHFAVWGLNRVLIREVSATSGGSGERLFGQSINFVLSISTLFFVSLLILNLLEIDYGIITTEVVYGVMGLPFLGLITLSQAYLRGVGQPVISTVPQAALIPGLFLIFIYVLDSASALSPLSAIILRTSVLVIVSIASLAYILSTTAFSTSDFSRGLLKPGLARKGSPFFSSALGNTTRARLPVILLGFIIGAESAGVYELGRRIARVFTLPLAALNVPLAPNISSAEAEGDMRKIETLTRTTALVSFAAVLLIGSVTLMGSFLFLPTLVDISLVEILPVIAGLLGGHLVSAAFGPVGLVLDMTGEEVFSAKVSIASVPLAVLAYLSVIPSYGATGAAVCTAFVLFVTNLAGSWYLSQTRGVKTIFSLPF